MGFFEKQANEINFSDLEMLVENKVIEHRILEYKRTINLDTDKEKKEFLKDISSFANSEGGYIFYGIDAVEGVPQKISGLINFSFDNVKLRIENIIQSCIRPRIQGIQFLQIIENELTIFYLFIPKSWNLPHMITFQDLNRFYSRNSAGVFLLDVDQLRDAFNSVHNIESKIKEFVYERVYKIDNGSSPIHIPVNDAKVVLHIIPYSYSYNNNSFDISGARTHFQKLPPINDAPIYFRFNIDGWVTYNKGQLDTSYLQFFRNGTIETTTNSIIARESNLIASKLLEERIIQSVYKSLVFYRENHFYPSFFVFISLTRLTGKRMALPQNKINMHHRQENKVFDRDIIILPELLLEKYNENINELARQFKTTFDYLWNSAGWEGSPNYLDDGNYVENLDSLAQNY